jgi:hypothetical protein
MTYSFNINQIETLNILTFDANINCDDLKNLKLTNSSLEFNIERREFENVRRSKCIFWTRTFLVWKESVLQFKNVKNFKITIGNDFKISDCSISKIISKNSFQIDLNTTHGSIISIDFFNDPMIELTDIKESDRHDGVILGSSGFTKDEWEKYLEQKKFTTWQL